MTSALMTSWWKSNTNSSISAENDISEPSAACGSGSSIPAPLVPPKPISMAIAEAMNCSAST